jgi:phage gp45-like
MNKRVKNLKPSEVVVHNPETSSLIHLKEDGSIDINAPVVNIISGETVINSPNKVLIGSYDESSLKKLVTEELQTLFNNHIHSSPAGGFTGTPTTPLTSTHLTQITKAK